MNHHKLLSEAVFYQCLISMVNLIRGEISVVKISKNRMRFHAFEVL